MSPHARHTSSSAVELSAEECGERSSSSSSSSSNSSSSGCTRGGGAKNCVTVCVCVRGCVVCPTLQLAHRTIPLARSRFVRDRAIRMFIAPPRWREYRVPRHTKTGAGHVQREHQISFFSHIDRAATPAPCGRVPCVRASHGPRRPVRHTRTGATAIGVPPKPGAPVRAVVGSRDTTTLGSFRAATGSPIKKDARAFHAHRIPTPDQFRPSTS